MQPTSRPLTEKIFFYISGLLVLCTALVLRFKNLGLLSLSGDEGFTSLAAEAILKHGYPLFDSGDIYYKSILYSYTAAASTLVFGLNEFALRLPNTLSSIGLVFVVFFALKKHAGTVAASIGATVCALSIWQIEFAREARYYCQLQFFFTNALVLFFSGFITENKKHRLWFFLSAVLAVFTLKLAIALILLFFIAPFFKGFCLFKDKSYWLWFGLCALIFGAWQLFEMLFWKMASINAKSADGSLLDSVLQIKYSFYFLKAYDWLFPTMTLVVVCGLVINAGLFIRKHVTGKTHRQLAFFSFLNITLFSILLLMGFGKAHYEPRYITFTAAIFFMLYAMTIGLIAEGATKILGRIFAKTEKYSALIFATAAFGLFAITCEGLNPLYNRKIPNRKYSDVIEETKFTSSTSRRLRWDCKTTGLYVKNNMHPDDIVIATHMIFARAYAGKCNYWLWTAGPGAWNAFVEKDERIIDSYLGLPLIRSLEELRLVLKDNIDKKIWLITTPSIKDHNHISLDIRRFLLEDNKDKIVCRGKDGISAVYMWDKEHLPNS